MLFVFLRAAVSGNRCAQVIHPVEPARISPDRLECTCVCFVFLFYFFRKLFSVFYLYFISELFSFKVISILFFLCLVCSIY